jgi:hypothetical protein
MASTDLTADDGRENSWRLFGGWTTFALTLSALWLITLLAAGLGELPALIAPSLRLHPHAAPSVHDVVMTWAHNVRTAGWPLLFAAAAGPYRQRWQRRLGDLLLAGSLIANGTLVGAAIAAGHQRILPYLPHLPLEWAAMALSSTAWLLASRSRLTRRQLVLHIAAFTALLAVAATVEIYAVPHVR